MNKVVAVISVVAALSFIGAITGRNSSPAQQQDAMVICDRKVIRSVETVQYDRARLIAVLRKEKAAGNCGISIDPTFTAGHSPAARNQTVCSGQTCLLLLRTDIYQEVIR